MEALGRRFPRKRRRVKCVQSSSRRWVSSSSASPPARLRRVQAGPWQRPQPQPDSRSSALARLSLPALVVAAPLASSLVVIPAEGGRSLALPLGHARRRRSLTLQRSDEVCACVGEANPARFEHVTREEKAGQIKAGGDVLRRRIIPTRLAQKCR